MGKDSGVIYKSFVDAVRELDSDIQLDAYNAYYAYMFDGEEYTGSNPVIKALLIMAKPYIDKANNRYEAAVENGKKGGAPKGNSNAKKQPENNQKTTRKQPENNQKTSKNNLTDTVTDTVTDTPKESIAAVKRHARHRFGEFKHVLLSDEEREKLIREYGEPSTRSAIRKVDEYCERTGKTYKNYNLVLRKWGFDGVGPPMSEEDQKWMEAIKEKWGI